MTRAADSKKAINYLTKAENSLRMAKIAMVEDILKKRHEFASKSALQRALPKTIQTQTFNRILNYLEKSNKIISTRDRAVVWIFSDDPKLRKVWEKSVQL